MSHNPKCYASIIQSKFTCHVIQRLIPFSRLFHSIAELLVESGQTKLSVFRSIRLLRIFKLVRPVRYQLLIVIHTMNSVITFFGLLFLFMFAFSILGMNLFGGKFVFRNAENEPMVTRSNFDSFLWAMVTVFQVRKLLLECFWTVHVVSLTILGPAM